MANELFRFSWDVPERGYQWIEATVVGPGDSNLNAVVGHARHYVLRDDGRDNSQRTNDRPQWLLTDELPVGASLVIRRYEPLENKHTGLFRIFATTPPEREAIQAFADKYGHLGLPPFLGLVRSDKQNVFIAVTGERLEDWVAQIDLMRRVVELWDMVRTGDVAGLALFIRWHEATSTQPGAWFYHYYPDLSAGKAPERGSADYRQGPFYKLIEPALDLFKPGDMQTPARFLVQRWINQALQHVVSPRLIYPLDVGKHVLRFMPENLLGALWLQFAQAIDGNKEYRACRECGGWFEVSLDAFRINRVFCSDPCKSKDYRRRKVRAQELRAEGKPVREIAEELETDAETIKKWVVKRRR